MKLDYIHKKEPDRNKLIPIHCNSLVRFFFMYIILNSIEGSYNE